MKFKLYSSSKEPTIELLQPIHSIDKRINDVISLDIQGLLTLYAKDLEYQSKFADDIQDCKENEAFTDWLNIKKSSLQTWIHNCKNELKNTNPKFTKQIEKFNTWISELTHLQNYFIHTQQSVLFKQFEAETYPHVHNENERKKQKSATKQISKEETIKIIENRREFTDTFKSQYEKRKIHYTNFKPFRNWPKNDMKRHKFYDTLLFSFLVKHMCMFLPLKENKARSIVKFITEGNDFTITYHKFFQYNSSHTKLPQFCQNMAYIFYQYFHICKLLITNTLNIRDNKSLFNHYTPTELIKIYYFSVHKFYVTNSELIDIVLYQDLTKTTSKQFYELFDIKNRTYAHTLLEKTFKAIKEVANNSSFRQVNFDELQAVFRAMSVSYIEKFSTKDWFHLKFERKFNCCSDVEVKQVLTNFLHFKVPASHSKLIDNKPDLFHEIIQETSTKIFCKFEGKLPVKLITQILTCKSITSYLRKIWAHEISKLIKDVPIYYLSPIQIIVFLERFNSILKIWRSKMNRFARCKTHWKTIMFLATKKIFSYLTPKDIWKINQNLSEKILENQYILEWFEDFISIFLTYKNIHIPRLQYTIQTLTPYEVMQQIKHYPQ